MPDGIAVAVAAVACRRERGAFWRSLEELLPHFEREDMAPDMEAHPDDFCEDSTLAVDLVHAVDRPWVHTVGVASRPHLGPDVVESTLTFPGDGLVTACALRTRDDVSGPKHSTASTDESPGAPRSHGRKPRERAQSCFAPVPVARRNELAYRHGDLGSDGYRRPMAIHSGRTDVGRTDGRWLTTWRQASCTAVRVCAVASATSPV